MRAFIPIVCACLALQTPAAVRAAAGVICLIGHLAVHQSAQSRRLGEKLLLDALRRAVGALAIVGRAGILADATYFPSSR